MNRIYSITIIILITLNSPATFGTMNDIINKARLEHKITSTDIADKNNNFAQYCNPQNFKNSQYQSIIQKLKNRHLQQLIPQKRNKPKPPAVVFVSFSMPILSLKQILQDANYYQIPVVLRGLHENSFRKTITKIFDLVKATNKGGVSLNPALFKQYAIKAVPAVVVNQSAADNTDAFDVVYGNISLKKALTIIAERGSIAHVAQKILQRNKQ